ncbi:MFS transporter [Rahnella sp. C60]|uniref:MFS transporter n=2 Tax=Rahnella perminowiae TaxID=2816244 RepID=A0ABS6KWY4_9GAMM|nr:MULTISPECIES: MFS transporter [Rahnella]MBU9812202.1 MFS transporter [Rahnella perminowiae]MBU9815521.1 MFS transporter [Rahnella perminowiae]MBU9826411.1 MFS transporter [Rahnella perminowiae]MBU9834110.1 MFS transporter [Rahnella perminowiae]MCR9001965.1 MFS transporter [Rahnella perminowiae]
MKNTLALMAVCLAALMSGLEISSVPVLSPVLERELHTSFRELQWIMNAYTLACTTVLMAIGTLADRYGRKRVFIISIAAFGLTSLMCGLAGSAQWLIAGRFLQGLSGGAMLTCLIAILSTQFPQGKARSQAFAAWGITFGFGLGFGPIIGGSLVAWLSWRWVFLVHVFIAVLTLILALKNVMESRDEQAKKLDLGGLITLSVTVMGATFLITQGGSLGWSSVTAGVVLLATAVSAVMFIRIEKYHPHPMFDFSVFRVRAFSGALMGSVGMNFSFWPLMIYLPVYYQGALGYGSVATGTALLAYTLPTLLMPPLGEKLTARFGASRVIPLGLFTLGAGFMLMQIAVLHHLSLLPGALLAGIALGLTNTPVTNTTTGSVAPNRAGMASGIDISARLITLTINIALMGILLVTGITASLKELMPAERDLSLLAERIAGGSVIETLQSGQVAQALTQGFAGILIYGAAGVWVLALLSYWLFNDKGRRKTVTCEPS